MVNWQDNLSESKAIWLKTLYFTSPFLILFALNVFNFNVALIFIIMSLTFSILAIIYAAHTLIWILKRDSGTPEMQKIAKYIVDGSEGFFVAQYTTIFKLSFLFCLGIMGIYYTRTPPSTS